MCRAFSDARNTASSATSSGCPMRRRPSFAISCLRASCGVMPLACARCCKSVTTRSVSVRPGWMTLTLTPSFLPSPDSALEKFAIAAFTEPPIVNSASGVRAAPPIMLTTWPSRSFSIGQNSFESRTQAKYFSAKPSWNASSGSSRKFPERVAPALLTSTSQRPAFSFTKACSASQLSSFLRSPAKTRGFGPELPISCAVLSRLACEEAASTVCAPSRANEAAIALPMPRLPPVTTTTFPENSLIVASLISCAGKLVGCIVGPSNGAAHEPFLRRDRRLDDLHQDRRRIRRLRLCRDFRRLRAEPRQQGLHGEVELWRADRARRAAGRLHVDGLDPDGNAISRRRERHRRLAGL